MSRPGDIGLDELNRRLAEIAAALDEDFRDPSPEHYALLQERDQLRGRAGTYRSSRDHSKEIAALEAELIELTRRRKSVVASRTGYVTSKGGNNHGPSPGAWIELAAQSWAASDMTRLNIRIGQIESELERRTAEAGPGRSTSDAT